MQRLILLIVGALALAGLTAPAHAQFGGAEKTAVKDDFALPAEGPLKILVFRPDIQVGSQTTAGINEPRAEWTDAARAELTAALERNLAGRSADMVMMPEPEGADGRVLADYRALFRTVAGTAIDHGLFANQRLPTKGRDFDWTLGPGTQELARIGGGDYGLFLFTFDSYGSTGRKILQVVALLTGMGFPSSGVHIGYAGLVDLKTGDIVWLNADLQMGGDVRTAEGAEKRVKQLLEGFPKRTAPVLVPAVVAGQEYPAPVETTAGAATEPANDDAVDDAANDNDPGESGDQPETAQQGAAQ